MKHRYLKKICSFLLTGIMMLSVFPYAGDVAYAQEETEITQVTEQQEISNAKVNTDGVIEVPGDGMVIVGGVYYGISKQWYETNNPEGKVLNLSLSIPDNVTTIFNDGFRDSWSNDKQKKGCVTNYNYDGDKTYTDKYTVVDIDFSNATNLTTINNQAAMGCSSLTGVLDLSDTKIETLGKSAFNGCTGLTGVILPETVKKIGEENGGSVFKGCTGLQFVHTADAPEAIFELPPDLESIGQDSFKGCTGFPANTTVSIPASVTFVGREAFNGTSGITTIFVETDDASTYDGGAFKGDEYGLGKRLTAFNNFSAKESFTPSGSNAYANSLTYEFTLCYDTVKTEKKLWGQAVNVCKGQDGNWYTDENYIIPETSGNAPVGYTAGWIYDDAVLTNKTILKPSGDELKLSISYVLQEPTVQFTVDGKVIQTEDTYPKLNLSNNKEHTIGVNVSHPIQTVDNADVKVKFEYEWTDVWKGGSQGPRMKEDGFGRYNLWDNADVTNTITVNGSTHERTNTGKYSGEDYGDGYYLLEIYGYSRSKTESQWELFYKSASTVIGSDPERTTNTAYMFDVVTSAPAQMPEVTFTGNSAVYGYDKSEIIASVGEIDGQTNTYQWYKATKNEPSSNGEKIEKATSESLQIETGKNAGEYYYYLEVISRKELNGDVVKTNFPVTFTVDKAQSSIQITTENMDKTYDGKVISEPTVDKTGSTGDVIFKWYVKDGNGWKKLDNAPVNAGSYKVAAVIAEDTNYNSAETEKTFEITKAVPVVPVLETLIIKQGEALSSIKIPTGFAWTDGTQTADELGKHTFKAVYTPSDTTNYQSVDVEIYVNVVPALISVNQIPTITAKDIVLTVGNEFNDEIALQGVTAHDKEDGDLTDKVEVVDNTVDTSKAGTYNVTYKVTDKDGASATKPITVTVRDKEEQPVTPTKPDTSVKTGDSTNVLLCSMAAVISLAGVITVLLFKRRSK